MANASPPSKRDRVAQILMGVYPRDDCIGMSYTKLIGALCVHPALDYHDAVQVITELIDEGKLSSEWEGGLPGGEFSHKLEETFAHWSGEPPDPFAHRIVCVKDRKWLRAVADAERKPDGKTDGKKKSWPRIPRNPDVLKLAQRIRNNTDPQRTKVDIAREFTQNDEKRAQSLLHTLRCYRHLLNGADTADG